MLNTIDDASSLKDKPKQRKGNNNRNTMNLKLGTNSSFVNSKIEEKIINNYLKKFNFE